MALSNGFHKFLDLIGIVSRDEPVSGRNERVGSSRGRYDDGGGDFSDENAGYDPPNVSRSERTSSVDRYHGSTMSSSRMADYDEVGNMVEFKTNHQPYGQSAPGEYRQKTVIHYLRDINDCKDIIDDLLNECQVVLNIEDADDVLKQRAIDMIYGAQYALHAKMRQVSRSTFIIAPQSVEVDQTDNRRTGGGYASNVRSFRS